MFWLSSLGWDWESNLLFSWQQGLKYVPSQVLESLFFIFPSSVYHLCLHWVLSLDMDEPLLESLSFPQSCPLVPLMVLSSPLTMLLQQCSLLPTHTMDATLKSSLKSISCKWPNNRIPKPSQNILHDKWNWMCRGDYTSEIKASDFLFSGRAIIQPLCVTQCFAITDTCQQNEEAVCDMLSEMEKWDGIFC